MESIKRNLKRSREAGFGKGEFFESSALWTIRGMVEYWADETTFRGDKLKGQDLVRWKKEVYSRIQELNKIFQEDEKLRKEARNEI
tara:strand:- start:697 stop:954 length:258 start_codon:yes stop_codon:yes gene_type:complete